MRVVLTKQEEALMEELRQRLSQTFGVTVVDDRVCLRWDGNSVSLSVDAFGFGTMHPDKCETCGGTNKLERAMIELTHANGDKAIWETKTCTYCRSPQ